MSDWPFGSEWRVSPSGALWRWWDGDVGWTEHMALLEEKPDRPPKKWRPAFIETAPIRIVPTELLPLEERR